MLIKSRIKTKEYDEILVKKINQLLEKKYEEDLGELIKKVDGFDMVFLKDIIMEMDTTRLGPDELHEFTTLVGSI